MPTWWYGSGVVYCLSMSQMSQSVSQSVSQSIYQSINQSTNLSTNLSIHQSVNQSTNRLIHQSVSQSINYWVLLMMSLEVCKFCKGQQNHDLDLLDHIHIWLKYEYHRDCYEDAILNQLALTTAIGHRSLAPTELFLSYHPCLFNGHW